MSFEGHLLNRQADRRETTLSRKARGRKSSRPTVEMLEERALMASLVFGGGSIAAMVSGGGQIYADQSPIGVGAEGLRSFADAEFPIGAPFEPPFFAMNEFGPQHSGAAIDTKRSGGPAYGGDPGTLTIVQVTSAVGITSDPLGSYNSFGVAGTQSSEGNSYGAAIPLEIAADTPDELGKPVEITMAAGISGIRSPSVGSVGNYRISFNYKDQGGDLISGGEGQVDSVTSGQVTFNAVIGDVFQVSVLNQASVPAGGYFARSVFLSVRMDKAPTINPAINIDYISTSSFITTDSIELGASVTGVPSGTQVFWTVQGSGAAADVSGFPTNVVTTTDADGVATFRFTPSDNQALVTNRRTVWSQGSDKQNPAICFQVIASMNVNGKRFESRLSDTNLGDLKQDETDCLRQEYYDYDIPVPARSEVVPSLGLGYNAGNYGVQLSVGLDARYNAILAAYRGRQVTVTIAGQRYNTSIPDNAPVTISSGYRNPQRNRYVGSRIPESRHTRGSALDLVPSLVQVIIMVNGSSRRVTLPLHEVLYPALQAAASTQGIAIAEQGARQVPVGDLRENHIHVGWQ